MRFAGTAPRPWRNGSGTTRELHRDEDWRLSVAEIGGPATFSEFPGFDRTLVVARGAVELSVDGVGYRLVAGEALAFPGEADVRAHAPDAPARVVNVMADRTRGGVVVEVARVSGAVPAAAGMVLLAGRATCHGRAGGPGDAVVPVAAGRVHAVHALTVLVRPRPRGPEGAS
ncbi:HutD family protein [Kineococcus gynurae]|uniref:HutD family protein n=1 Tax=Kineococcus gynurae TaxID=452979 RepID=A0ABV5LPG3_9ACTN